MTYQRFEHEIRAALDEGAPMSAPNHLLHSFEYNARRTRRYPRWLALIKEPTMRTDNHLAVGSPTVRVATIVVATLLLAVAVASAGVAGQRLLAAEGEIIVAQDGSGTYETITEAVEAADDGDTILIRPGTYTEAVAIAKDVTVRGDGPTDEIVVTAPADGPTFTASTIYGDEPYAFLLTDTAATITGLTVQGDGSAIIASGGSPTIEGNVVDSVGMPFDGSSLSGTSIVVTHGSTASVLDNDIRAGGEFSVFGEANPTIEGNRLVDGPHIYLREPGSDTVVRDNDISGTLSRAIAVSGPGTILIEDNRISDPGSLGIRVGRNTGAVGFEPTIRNNTIEGASSSGIGVTTGGSPRIVGNSLSGNGTGISWIGAAGSIEDNSLIDNGSGISLGGDADQVIGNTISGGRNGITITTGSTALDDNKVTGASGRGLAIGSGSSPVLTGNVSCENGENLWVADDAAPDIDETNEICEEQAAE